MRLELTPEELDLLAGQLAERLAQRLQAAPGPLLSAEQLANHLGVPVGWVYQRTRLKDAGRIPHVKVGRYARFNLPEVLAWLKESGLTDG